MRASPIRAEPNGKRAQMPFDALSRRLGLAIKLAASHQATCNVGRLQRGAFGRRELTAQQWSMDRPGFADNVRRIQESLARRARKGS